MACSVRRKQSHERNFLKEVYFKLEKKSASTGQIQFDGKFGEVSSDNLGDDNRAPESQNGSGINFLTTTTNWPFPIEILIEFPVSNSLCVLVSALS